MILNNISFLSFLILIVFTYLIYDIYQINNTQIENFFRRRRRGRSIFSRIKSFVVKKIATPVSNFFNIQRKLRLERERREREERERREREERERKARLDIVRNNYQVNINNLNNTIKNDNIPSLSKSSQSFIKNMNTSSKITNNTYIKSLKDDVLNDYLEYLN